MKTRNGFLVIIASAMFASATMAQATEGVSPGAPDHLAVVNDACPTFSWQDDEAATVYEIVAYSLHTNESPAAAELAAEAEVLYSQVPAGATSWTPSAEQCFAPGGRYVWFVRPVMELAADQVIEAGEWSAGRYFSVPAGPSAEDVAGAIETLRRWEAANGGGSLSLSPAAAAAAGAGAAPASGAGAGGGAGANHRKSVPTASAAIRGVNPEYDLEAYGVVGISNSVWGAGVAAANTEGGPDLLLDGSYDGGVSTSISEWGIARSAPTDQVLYVRNYGGGAITFDVAGTLRGTALECPGCVEESDLAEESVTSIAIEDSGITEEDIAMGAVFSHHIYDGTIQAQDLSFDAVDGDTIVDGSVAAADLADGAVTPSKIQQSAVHTDNLHDGAVTEDKIAPGAVLGVHVAFETIEGQDIADDAITHSKIANGAIDTNHLPDNVITSAKIADGTVTMLDLASESVGSDEIEYGGVRTDDIDFGAVGTGQLADGAVTAAKLAPGAIASATLEDGAVTTSKIADQAVTTAKLDDRAVTSAKIGLGQVWEENLVLEAVSATKIANGAVVMAKIANSAVTGAKIADLSITGADIAAGAVGQGHLASSSVSESKLATGSVTGAKIANGSVTATDVKPHGGIYSSRSAIYTRQNSIDLAAGIEFYVSASCDDLNDLPLAGSCTKDFGSADCVVTEFSPMDWDSRVSPAGYGCSYSNGGSTTVTINAGIRCLEVDDP